MEPQRQQMNRHGGHEPANGLMLHDVQQRRIDTKHHSGPHAAHAKRVISVAAADVEHCALIEWLNFASNAVPLHVGAPLRIDRQVTNAERALSPRRQTQQQFAALPVDVGRAGQ